MKISRLRKIGMFAATGLFAASAHSFEIYGFVPYRSWLQAGEVIKGAPSDAWFLSVGMRPIEVVYDNRILDIPRAKSSKNQAIINSVKLDKIAIKHRAKNALMVSLDLETWDRYDPSTPSRVVEVIKAYRSQHPEAYIGLYSTVPQNTYSWQRDRIPKYEKINEAYGVVAAEVDYFSPSLYNYGGANFEDWKEGANFNIQASRKYDANKKVYPYITPEVKTKHGYRWLTYDEMLARLRALSSLGADGCIVWASSRSRLDSGEAPVLDPSQGWLKAISDFSQQAQ